MINYKNKSKKTHDYLLFIFILCIVIFIAFIIGYFYNIIYKNKSNIRENYSPLDIKFKKIHIQQGEREDNALQY